MEYIIIGIIIWLLIKLIHRNLGAERQLAFDSFLYELIAIRQIEWGFKFRKNIAIFIITVLL